jgi:hypothetical protein
MIIERKLCVSSAMRIDGGWLESVPRAVRAAEERAAAKRRPAAPARPAGPPIFNRFALKAAIEEQLAAVARTDPQAELRWLRDSFYAKYAR